MGQGHGEHEAPPGLQQMNSPSGDTPGTSNLSLFTCLFVGASMMQAYAGIKMATAACLPMGVREAGGNRFCSNRFEKPLRWFRRY